MLACEITRIPPPKSRLAEDEETWVDYSLTCPVARRIYTLGHRNTLGLMVHPETGALWNNENRPNGGDEINIILPGRNYGWPVISFGRDYPGPRISEHPTREGLESPLLVWLPSIAVSGTTVYTGHRF